jgi:hypothetical protein
MAFFIKYPFCLCQMVGNQLCYVGQIAQPIPNYWTPKKHIDHKPVLVSIFKKKKPNITLVK